VLGETGEKRKKGERAVDGKAHRTSKAREEEKCL